MAERALTDLKIVECGSFISAAYCTKLMADLGAEVIKVEPPNTGDEARHYGPFPGDIPDSEKSGLFLWLNTNKSGVTIDPSKPKGRELLLELLEDADVFVQNYPTRLLKKLKLDFNSLKKVNPRLIVTSITPYGQTGPYRNWKGYDINCGALGGISASMGYPDREPLSCPLFQGDYQAGLDASIATMIALFQRDITGSGMNVDISEAECWATFHVGVGMQAFVEEGRVRRRSGHVSPHRPFPDEVLPCKDGYVCIDTPQKKQWARLLDIMGNPEWANDPIFENRIQTTDQHIEQADAYLTGWLKQYTKEELFKMCQDNKIPLAPIKTVEEVVNDEHLKEREYFVDVDHPRVGKLKFPGVSYKFSETPFTIESHAPCLGEHNEQVLCGRMGYSRDDLIALRRAEVI